MDKGRLQVNMLGGFSITWNGETIDEKDNRSRKMWLLLAYLIYCRNRSISQNEIISLLWDSEEGSVNPQGALKTTLHRARTLLNRLYENAGHELIIRQDNTYAWNTEIEMDFDVDVFDSMAKTLSVIEEEEERLNQCLDALELYQGDFLPKLSMEAWVVPISAYYHNIYISTVQEALELLEKSERAQEAVAICENALKIEPYSENLYCHLLKNLIATGQKEAAVSAYEELNKQLLANFGIMPSDEIRALYREALRTDNGYVVPIDTIREQLRESNPSSGALFCDYDFFKILYQAYARAIARTGETIHIGLISVKGQQKKALSQSSLDLVMKNLQEQICTNVRRGDVATRCSASQFLVMLPRANYESSCMVCGRIVRSFYRQYPHSPAEITFSVQPMEPTL